MKIIKCKGINRIDLSLYEKKVLVSQTDLIENKLYLFEVSPNHSIRNIGVNGYYIFDENNYKILDLFDKEYKIYVDVKKISDKDLDRYIKKYPELFI
jgi:hypothetical protein